MLALLGMAYPHQKLTLSQQITITADTDRGNQDNDQLLTSDSTGYWPITKTEKKKRKTRT